MNKCLYGDRVLRPDSTKLTVNKYNRYCLELHRGNISLERFKELTKNHK